MYFNLIIVSKRVPRVDLFMPVLGGNMLILSLLLRLSLRQIFLLFVCIQIFYIIQSQSKTMKQYEFNEMFQQKQQQLLDMIKRELRNKNAELEEALERYKELESQYEKIAEIHENNVNVIEELEKQNSIIRAKYIGSCKESSAKDNLMADLKNKHQEQKLQHLHQLTELQRKAVEWKTKYQQQILQQSKWKTYKNETQKSLEQLQLKHKFELEQISQIAAQKIKSQESYYQKNLNNYKNETEAIIRDLKTTNHLLVTENKTLLSTINTTKSQNLELQTQSTQKIQSLQTLLQQTQHSQQIYQSELQNLKNNNNLWQQTLTQKITSLQEQKYQILQQFTQYKLGKKHKISSLKQQYQNKVEQLRQTKSQQLKKYEEVIKHLKLQNEKLEFTNSQFKKQIQELQKMKKLESNQIEKKNTQFIRNFQEDKKYFKNQLELKQLKIDQLFKENQYLEKINSDNKGLIEKLRHTFDEKTDQYNQLNKEFIKYKNDMKLKFTQLLSKNIQNQNAKNQNQIPRQQKQQKEIIQYSKIFSEDMGPVDQNWIQKNLKSNFTKKSPNQQPLQQMYENKRVTQLQIENSQYKQLIFKLEREMQETRQTFTTKMDLKDRQIKLCRDQSYMLRDKLHEKQQQISRTRQKTNNSELQIYKLQQSIKKLKQIEGKEIQQTKKKIQQLTKENSQLLNQIIPRFKSEIQELQQQRETLITISNQLKAEIRALRDNTQQYADQTDRQEKYSQQQLANFTSQNEFIINKTPFQQNSSQMRQLFSPLSKQPSSIKGDKQRNNNKKYFEAEKQQQLRTEKKSKKNNLVNNNHDRVSQNIISDQRPIKKKPETLLNLLKQRKKLLKNTQENQRQHLMNFQVIAEQARLEIRDRNLHMPRETESQREIYERMKRKSRSKESEVASIPQPSNLNELKKN